ncbi:oligosaccharide flippase family protein [uncultured Pseudomonas sp.]|uniref:lipopolysaccharide biosynthesis protein n=1 Tax=uncultured Pseudomonas sp. TaxID=114707 RepID=UPI0027DB889C|nr:oligosaccharide flippase family protein [uncultured Pseudomonas sp.]
MKNNKLASLKSLLAASVSGKIVYALSSLVSLPLLTKLLGAESIGLIGFFTTLLMVMMVLEGGLTSNLIQQLASYKSRSVHAYQRYAMATKCLVFTYVSIFVAIGVVVAVVILLLSGYIADHWLQFESVTKSEVARCIELMALFIGLNFVVMALQGVLVGRESQKILNVFFLPYAFIRTMGAWLLLKFVFNIATVVAYFELQLVVQIVYVCGLFYALHKEQLIVPAVKLFRVWYLKKGVAFSRGVLFISLSSMLVVQYDKIYLSGSVPLSTYASYTLACTLAGLPYIFSSAFSSVLFPRFSIDITKGDNERVSKIFVSSVSIIFLLMMLFIVAIYFYSPAVVELIFAKTIADEVNSILPVLVIATSIQCLLVVPFALQLAAKWTSLSLRINLVCIPLIIGLLPVMVREWGVNGGAYIWLGYNMVSLGCTFYYVAQRFEFLKPALLGKVVAVAGIMAMLCVVHYGVSSLTAQVENIYLALSLQVLSIILTLFFGLYFIKKDIMNFK